MSLSTLLTSVAEYVGDQLVNGCCLAVPDRVIRYHGPIPHDCCSDSGFIAVSWERQYASAQFPVETSTQTSPCAGPMAVVVSVRFVKCWQIPDVDENGVRLADDTWDADAATLADISDCISRALIALACNPDRSDPFVDAVMDHTDPPGSMTPSVRFLEAKVIADQGGCAGVEWRLICRVLSPTPSS